MLDNDTPMRYTSLAMEFLGITSCRQDRAYKGQQPAVLHAWSPERTSLGLASVINTPMEVPLT
jgi:hypothetical protein